LEGVLAIDGERRGLALTLGQDIVVFGRWLATQSRRSGSDDKLVTRLMAHSLAASRFLSLGKRRLGFTSASP